MKNTLIRLILSTLAISMAVQSTGYAESSEQDPFTTPATLNVKYASLDDVLKALCMQLKYGKTPISVDVDAGVHAKLKRDEIKCSCQFYNMEMKYALAWAVHLAGVNAIIRDDGSVFIATKDDLKKSDTLFKCWMETKGQWRDELVKRLDDKIVEASVYDSSFGSYLNAFHRRYALPFVLDPAVLTEKLNKSEVALHTDPNIECGEELTYVLKQVGLTYKLQGGIVFITK